MTLDLVNSSQKTWYFFYLNKKIVCECSCLGLMWELCYLFLSWKWRTCIYTQNTARVFYEEI